MPKETIERTPRTDTAALERRYEKALEGEERYRQLVHGLPVAVYMTDAEGSLKFYNEAAALLWGFEPAIGEPWHVAYKAFRADGEPLRLEEYPMTMALKERRPVRGVEFYLERPDGTR